MVPRNRTAEWLARRTRREQRLAIAVAGLAVLFLCAVAARAAVGTVQRLDREISQLQTDIVNLSYQIARRQSVEARYAEVAAQHSSVWSESEIRDRLRLEIYRLANRVPPALDANGVPLSTGGESDPLVRIPELRGGRLIDTGENYREYQLEFHVQPAPLPDLLAYLEYLHGSPQSLRIDTIDLRRDPGRSEIAARIGLSRIVVDDPEESPAVPAPDTVQALDPDRWTCEGCTARASATGNGVNFQSGPEGGSAWMHQTLAPNALYEVVLELAANGPATISAVTAPAAAQPDTIAIPGDGQFYRCHFYYRAPASDGDSATVRLPLLEWDATAVNVRNLHLTRRPEAPHGA